MGGRIIDGAQLRYAFLDALDLQRDRFVYTRHVEAALTCRALLVGGPSKPGREGLVSAIQCDSEDANMDLAATALSDRALRRLQDAWAQARPHLHSDPVHGEDECTELQQRPSEIIARTDRGDVVRFFASPCGYLVFRGTRPSETLEIPLEFHELA
jgi:hypothetical protein